MDIDPSKVNWPLVDRLKDSLQSARDSHWNVLLTFNGILIGAFSVLGALERVNRCLVLVLISCSILSSALLIWNFISFENTYDQLIKKAVGKLPPPTPSDRDQRLKQRDEESRWRERRTRIAQVLLIIQSIVLFVIIYSFK